VPPADACDLIDCVNGGHCIHTGNGGAACSCPPGFRGPICALEDTINVVVVFDAQFASLVPAPARMIGSAFAMATQTFDDASAFRTPSDITGFTEFIPAVTLRLGATLSWVDAVPPGMIYPSGSDPIDGQSLLNAFDSWVASVRPQFSAMAGSPADEVILVTGHALIGPDSTLSGTLCGSSNVGVVGARGARSLTDINLGLLLARALGHSFGAPLDPVGSLTVMDPALPNEAWVVPPYFSAASASALNTWYSQSLGSSYQGCLEDAQPAISWASPFCGDGRVDGTEDCDPGLGRPDACCTSSCHIAPGCACADSDPCCSGGVIASAGVVCHAAVDAACDVARVCDGVHSACPPPAPVANGTACTDANGQPSLCFEGVCSESRTSACRAINNGQSPASTGCDTSTNCTVLQCSSLPDACDLSFPSASVPNGAPCGGAGNPTSSICAAGVCVSPTSEAALAYAWTVGPWSSCSLADDTETRDVQCVSFPGNASAPAGLCDIPVPGSIRPCP
jgi:hypothetical protein